MNRFDIYRQRTPSFLAITPEKDTHVHNREHVPLKGNSHDFQVRVRYKSLKEHSHDFTYRAQMIVLNVYNDTIDDLRRCTFFGRQ